MNEAGGRNIVLVGFMGTGKSSVGRRIAGQLGYRFVDTDRLVVEKTGLPITEIFRLRGEERFRVEETESLLSLEAIKAHVIATGGGVVTVPSNIPRLRTLGLVVCLTASEEVILERVSRNDKRPLLKDADPAARIRELLAARAPLYQAAAHFTVDTSLRSHDEVASAIIAESRRVPYESAG